jgi:hypothetical protein
MKRATFKWKVLGNVCVSCSSAGEIPEEDWNAHLKALESAGVIKALTSTVGPIDVDSTHRKQAAEVVMRKHMRCAMVTDERLVRGLVTAISWLGVDIKAYAWDEARRALEYLDVPASLHDRVHAVLLELRQACVLADAVLKTAARAG